jgi:uncharacterized protein YfiM (DUF2279 family)
LKIKKQILLTLIIGFSVSIYAQDTLNVARLKTVVASETILYSSAMIGLHQLWYKNEPSTSFHSFNDNQQWLYMDKVGHTMTSYYIGKVGYSTLRWSGVTEKKSVWFGGTLGLVFLSSVEVFDGFSKGWGFSNGDMAANVLGSGLFIGQQLGWKEQRVLLKYSFYPSEYADLRPNVLGENFLQQTLKDYNGQTYWLSINIASFLSDDTRFPKWLNVAVGYGADGLIGGTENKFWSNNKFYDYTTIERKKQFFLSLDVDLTKIKTNNSFLSAVFNAFGFIKFPFPALVYEDSGTIQFLPVQ